MTNRAQRLAPSQGPTRPSHIRPSAVLAPWCQLRDGASTNPWQNPGIVTDPDPSLASSGRYQFSRKSVGHLGQVHRTEIVGYPSQ